VTGTDEAGGIFIGQIDGPERTSHRRGCSGSLCLFGELLLSGKEILFAQSPISQIYLGGNPSAGRRTGGIQYPTSTAALSTSAAGPIIYRTDRAFSANSCGLIARERDRKKLRCRSWKIRRILAVAGMAAGS